MSGVPQRRVIDFRMQPFIANNPARLHVVFDPPSHPCLQSLPDCDQTRLDREGW